MQFTTYVLDDEQAAVELLQDFITRVPYLKLAGSNINPVNAFEEIKQLKPQILFCDIDMPSVSGLTVIDQINAINSWECFVVIVSGHVHYGMEGYERNVKGFLLKPCIFEHFWKTVERARQFLETIPPPITDPVLQQVLKINPVSAGSPLVHIPLYELRYIESEKNFITIYHGKDNVTTSRRSLKSVMEELPATHFTQVYQSVIIAINEVAEYNQENIILKCGTTVKIGISYRQQFLRMMKQRLQFGSS